MVQKAIERLVYLANIIPDKIRLISDEEFSYKLSVVKWSKKEILGHLIDSAANNHQKFIRVQFEDSPSIWYDQNKWVETNNYAGFASAELISFWAAYNTHIAAIIKRIPLQNMNKTCTMRDGNKVTLEFLIIDYVSHLEHHLRQITDY